jgi:hypothetical protein
MYTWEKLPRDAHLRAFINYCRRQGDEVRTIMTHTDGTVDVEISRGTAMAKNVSGVVARKSEKEWEGDNGTILLYSFQIEGDRQWYRTGTTDLPAQVGESIRFVFDKGRVDVDSVEVVPASEVAKAPKPRGVGSVGSKSGSYQSKDDYWAAKDRHDKEVKDPQMKWQGARKDAIAVVGLALQHGALDVSKAAKAKQLDAIIAAIEEVTVGFFNDSSTKPFEQGSITNNEAASSRDD